MPAPSKKARVNLVADFETTTTPERTRVWSWGAVGVEDPTYDAVKVGHDIETFMSLCQARNANIYFHNLKFDGQFIMYWLLTHGYTHTTSKTKTNRGEFKSLIDGRGIWFSVTVKWRNGKTTEFRDSWKKLPMALERVATSFGLAETKGEIDYEAPRPVGYRMTAEEEDYLRRDVCIIAQALAMEFDEGMTKLTVASDSMSEFKRVFGEEKFKRVFPVLPTELDAELRQAYRGGWTYADDRTMGAHCGQGAVYDVNSLYPSVMYDSLLPYGEPRYARGYAEPTDQYPLSIFSVTFTGHLKKDHVPVIQIKGQAFFTNTEYLKDINEPTTLWVTSVDWELWNEHYDLEVQSYNGGWLFKAAIGFFDEYIDKWSFIKVNSTGGKKEIAKLHLNSLYGKFASNPKVTSRIPVLDNDRLKFTMGEEETRAPVYTAMGAFITAYARRVTISAAQANYDVFAYADTDSVHLLSNQIPSGITVHQSDLGAWKREMVFTEAMYVRAKFYLEKKDGIEWENHVAGLPKPMAAELRIEDIYENHVLDRAWLTSRTGKNKSGKMRPTSVPGGIVLMDTPFTVKL